MDGAYGAGNSYPTGVVQSAVGGGGLITLSNYTPANYDDITNFTTRTTIQDDIP